MDTFFYTKLFKYIGFIITDSDSADDFLEKYAFQTYGIDDLDNSTRQRNKQVEKSMFTVFP